MMLHCPNLNDTRSAGPLTEAELDASIAANYIGACTANACQSGRAPCPCPDACRVPADELDDVAASMWFWCVLAIALVGFGFLASGGLSMLLDWLRGVMA